MKERMRENKNNHLRDSAASPSSSLAAAQTQTQTQTPAGRSIRCAPFCKVHIADKHGWCAMSLLRGPWKNTLAVRAPLQGLYLWFVSVLFSRAAAFASELLQGLHLWRGTGAAALSSLVGHG